MTQHGQNILVTRSLSTQQIAYTRQLGLEPIIEPAIEIKFPQYGNKIAQVIEHNPESAWVFTSANGVSALKKRLQAGLDVSPHASIYAVGSKTREAVQSLGFEAQVPATQDGKHLAELISAEGESAVLYFQGNLSRDEMTAILRNHGVQVTEQEVYQTHIQPVEMPDEPVRGILFYSPSAVEGFKRGNGFKQELPTLFAIGPTTAAALREETNQQVEVARIPDTKVMLQMVSRYLH